MQNTLTLGGAELKTLSTRQDLVLNKYSGSFGDDDGLGDTDDDIEEKVADQRSTPGSNMLAKQRSRTAAGQYQQNALKA